MEKAGCCSVECPRQGLLIASTGVHVTSLCLFVSYKVDGGAEQMQGQHFGKYSWGCTSDSLFVASVPLLIGSLEVMSGKIPSVSPLVID